MAVNIFPELKMTPPPTSKNEMAGSTPNKEQANPPKKTMDQQAMEPVRDTESGAYGENSELASDFTNA